MLKSASDPDSSVQSVLIPKKLSVRSTRPMLNQQMYVHKQLSKQDPNV